MFPRGETVESQGAAAPWSGKNRQSGPPRRQLRGWASLEESLGVRAVFLLGEEPAPQLIADVQWTPLHGLPGKF